MTIARAASVPLPSLNEIPIPDVGDKYTPAFSKAREALYIYSGIEDFYNKLRSYTDRIATKYENKAKSRYELMATNINMNPHWTYFAIGFTHTILIKKELVFKFKNKRFNRVNHSISISRDQVYTGIQIAID